MATPGTSSTKPNTEAACLCSIWSAPTRVMDRTGSTTAAEASRRAFTVTSGKGAGTSGADEAATSTPGT